MLSIFSFVNTLEKNSLRASDFSLGEVTFLPSGLIRDGILCLFFNLEFVYFQNNFGFVLTLRARLCSKSRRSFRVRLRKSFLQRSWLVLVVIYLLHILCFLFLSRNAALVMKIFFLVFGWIEENVYGRMKEVNQWTCYLQDTHGQIFNICLTCSELNNIWAIEPKVCNIMRYLSNCSQMLKIQLVQISDQTQNSA